MNDKRVLLTIIKNGGHCDNIPRCADCPIGAKTVKTITYCIARLDKTETIVDCDVDNDHALPERKRKYAIALYIKLFGKTELFEVLI